jgi:peptide chain release factor subunit 1
VIRKIDVKIENFIGTIQHTQKSIPIKVMDAHVEIDDDPEIARWKIKRMIQYLDNVRGNGTSMISLLIPPREQLPKINQMLTEEYSTATNIKSRVNRQSVLAAITSAQNRLKLYAKVPPKGLVLYCGIAMTEDGKEKKLTLDFEPIKPLTESLYECGSRFRTEALHAMLESDEKFGFIVIDGHTALFGLVSGRNRTVLKTFDVELPNKQGRGGQSKLRFERIRLEKRHNYVRKVAETATQLFITENQPNITGLVLAGSADFKNELNKSDLLDARLQKVVVKIVDVAYSGENGFNQAIEKAEDTLSNVRLMIERSMITTFMTEIARDTGKYAFGVTDTLRALEMGAVETLLVWDTLELQHPMTSENLLEWLTQNYKRFGAKLVLVSDKTSEGSQFCRGFGGLGGLLRYKVEFEEGIDDTETNLENDFI